MIKKLWNRDVRIMFEKLSVMNRKFEDEFQNDFRDSNARTHNTGIIPSGVLCY
jgi:hypothetical protein